MVELSKVEEINSEVYRLKKENEKLKQNLNEISSSSVFEECRNIIDQLSKFTKKVSKVENLQGKYEFLHKLS